MDSQWKPGSVIFVDLGYGYGWWPAQIPDKEDREKYCKALEKKTNVDPRDIFETEDSSQATQVPLDTDEENASPNKIRKVETSKKGKKKLSLKDMPENKSVSFESLSLVSDRMKSKGVSRTEAEKELNASYVTKTQILERKRRELKNLKGSLSIDQMPIPTGQKQSNKQEKKKLEQVEENRDKFLIHGYSEEGVMIRFFDDDVYSFKSTTCYDRIKPYQGEHKMDIIKANLEMLWNLKKESKKKSDASDKSRCGFYIKDIETAEVLTDFSPEVSQLLNEYHNLDEDLYSQD